MDIDNLGMIEQKFWKHQPQAWLFFYYFFFTQGVNESASLEEHRKYREGFCKRGPFQGQLRVKKFLFWAAAP